MPSPVGHSLIGLALGLGVYLRRGTWGDLKPRVREAAAWLLAGVVLANVPDLDYLPGLLQGDFNAYHHGYTHSLGWIAVVGGGGWLLWRSWSPRVGLREAAFVFAALASHLVADWVTDDGRAPYGIMALWPFRAGFTLSPATIFWRLHKKDYTEILQWHNAAAVLVEIAWCLPLVLTVLWRKSTGGTPARADAPPVARTS
jgi:inner membrane protein